MSIFVGEGADDYSAMQGPCPEGFHVPLSSEWRSIGLILTSTFGLAGNSTTMANYLKMPMAGYRRSSSSNTENQGSYGYYWSSSPRQGIDYYAILLSFTSSNVGYQDQNYRAFGFSIRPFKNSPIIPDSNWTTLYQGTGSSGIFYNSSLGLISISGDGSTRYTIADKNLGATTVYNSGNTLSEANCGKYYQRGNNYGFPRTGNVTNSTTQVNASTYGPGNYYSSSTFIKINGAWDSSNNGDLRGGETGIVKRGNVKEVYVGTTKVRPEDTRTFTISRTEQSDMSNGWIYSDDAAGLTEGDIAFDEFFGYYGCRLNTSGVETAKVTQGESGGAGNLKITDLGTITSGDNVMIAFPKIGVKMTKNGSTVTLSLTKDKNKSGYQYYAFNRNGTIQDKFYLGAYKGCLSSSKIVSLSGKSPVGNSNIDNYRSRCVANGTNYGQVTIWQRWFVNALYIMKYGNPNAQVTIGRGYTYSNSSKKNTGGTNSYTSASWGESGGKTQAKLFGLEDWWGNCREYTDGIYVTPSKEVIVDTSNNPTSIATRPSSPGGNWISTGMQYRSQPNGAIQQIVGTNDGMFMFTKASGSGYSYYYGDTGVAGEYAIAACGGYKGSNYEAGPFCLELAFTATSSDETSSRLMYL